ncbi:MAG TPA: serine hydrolase, partial [Gemmatimonadales bacterium]|nr:serine hydrolase [Gemmatimonadales bacterium]
YSTRGFFRFVPVRGTMAQHRSGDQPVRPTRRHVLLATASALSAPHGSPHAQHAALSEHVPGSIWENVDLGARGWSRTGREEAREAARAMPPGSVFISEAGRKVLSWGDDSRRVKLSSVRKSFLSALFGTRIPEGRIHLDRNLAEIGIDDEPPLTATERTATVRMLLQSRSGVFRPFVGGSLEQRARLPSPGSHAPGTFWYYNNWDFNALGTIYERLTESTIRDDFVDRIAKPVRMEDFRAEDMYYFRGSGIAAEQSIHPAYHFRMSARDAARFGHLYLRRGAWNGRMLIPPEWIRESVTVHSAVGRGGYGYLWWIDDWPGVTVRSYSARGVLGKYICVIPDRDLVVVYLNHTDFPDDAAALPREEVARLPRATSAQFGRFLSSVLAAQPS